MQTVCFLCLHRQDTKMNIVKVVFAYIHALFVLCGIPHEGRGVARNSAGNAFLMYL